VNWPLRRRLPRALTVKLIFKKKCLRKGLAVGLMVAVRWKKELTVVRAHSQRRARGSLVRKCRKVTAKAA
jgi:hypothetical protein